MHWRVKKQITKIATNNKDCTLHTHKQCAPCALYVCLWEMKLMETAYYLNFMRSRTKRRKKHNEKTKLKKKRKRNQKTRAERPCGLCFSGCSVAIWIWWYIFSFRFANFGIGCEFVWLCSTVHCTLCWLCVLCPSFLLFFITIECIALFGGSYFTVWLLSSLFLYFVFLLAFVHCWMLNASNMFVNPIGDMWNIIAWVEAKIKHELT